MSYEKHLSVVEELLPPGSEWRPVVSAWAVVRVLEGAGQVVQRADARNVGTGEVLLLWPEASLALRAGETRALRIQFFLVFPELLTGLLTSGEHGRLEALQQKPGLVRGLAAHPAATSQLEAVKGAVASESRLRERCQLLGVFAGLVGELLNQQRESHPSFSDAPARFRQIVEPLHAGGLEDLTVPELARRCGCSARHFSRLFREHYGRSVRAKQIELRLQKARKLLRDAETKVIHVALESGYRHLGLFNASFKRRFGVTPSEWRRRNLRAPQKSAARRPLAVAGLLAAFILTLVQSTLAQDAAAPAPAVTFLVRGYDVEGNTVLPSEVVDKILADHTGPAVTLDQIKAALKELQLAYYGRGFHTVTAYFPPQQLTNGTVRIAVVESRLAEINVVNNSFFSSNNIMRALPGLHTNVLLNGQLFQPLLDQANANRDRQIYPVLSPGPDPGTTTLTLKVKDQLPLHGKLELNNQATPGTPPLRVNTSMQYGNLWQLEHQLGVQYGFTPLDYKEQNPLPEKVFDHPLIANYSAFYRLPLLGAAPVGEVSALDYSAFGYDEVTRKFNLPAGSGRPELSLFASRSTTDTGVKRSPWKTDVETPVVRLQSQSSGQDFTTSEGFGARFSQPLPERHGLRSTLSGGFDFKFYRLDSYNTNTFLSNTTLTNGNVVIEKNILTSFDQPANHSSIAYVPVTLRWDASWTDKLGSTAFGLNGSFNFVGDRKDFVKLAGSSKASGQFGVLSPSLTREQKLYEEWTVLLRADGQWASEPLISNEQYALGGSGGIRGYEEGEAFGDSGWRVIVEPRTPLVDIGMVDGNMPMHVRGSIFTDYGELYLNDPGDRKARKRMWGAGFGVTASIGQTFDARFSIGWALLDTTLSHAGGARAYFGVGAQF